MVCWCNSSHSCSALGTWFFSVVGALVAIPAGIKKKSLAPLVFFGTTGTMLDIIMGISQCEREHAERQMKLLEAQNISVNAAAENESSESIGDLDKWKASFVLNCGITCRAEFLLMCQFDISDLLKQMLSFLFPNNL
jgi:hypothetical protein